MSENKTLNEREEIESLLPWYVVGTLTDAEMKRVGDYIVRHPALERQLKIIRDEMAETTAANEALPSAPAGALGRLMDDVRKEQPSTLAVMSRAHRGLWREIASLFSAPTRTGVRWATAVAAAVILAQAVAIGVFMTGQSDGGYETASGPAPAAQAPGTRVLVQFKATANAPAIAKFLEELGGEIVGGPKPGGSFIIRVSDKPLAETEKNAIMTRLRARGDLIGLVLPTE